MSLQPRILEGRMEIPMTGWFGTGNLTNRRSCQNAAFLAVHLLTASYLRQVVERAKKRLVVRNS
jgi:hypothetical protein